MPPAEVSLNVRFDLLRLTYVPLETCSVDVRRRTVDSLYAIYRLLEDPTMTLAQS